jgi:hypothetical protein
MRAGPAALACARPAPSSRPPACGQSMRVRVSMVSRQPAVGTCGLARSARCRQAPAAVRNIVSVGSMIELEPSGRPITTTKRPAPLLRFTEYSQQNSALSVAAHNIAKRCTIGLHTRTHTHPHARTHARTHAHDTPTCNEPLTWSTLSCSRPTRSFSSPALKDSSVWSIMRRFTCDRAHARATSRQCVHREQGRATHRGCTRCCTRCTEALAI